MTQQEEYEEAFQMELLWARRVDTAESTHASPEILKNLIDTMLRWQAKADRLRQEINKEEL